MDCCQPKSESPILRIRNKLSKKHEIKEGIHGPNKVILVGTPNVGKSVIFNALTGAYVTVSNYPGTTVEISHGRATFGGSVWHVIDTPGLYSLMLITEEERVTRKLLLEEHPELVLHVTDAKNIERMLNLTLQLIEAGLPVALVVNLMDEAERCGLRIDIPRLQSILGIPVVPTAATQGRGLKELKETISSYSINQQRKAGEAICQTL
jgi:ferrous iron transport protein B